MPENIITVAIPVGTLAALLTTIEYLLSITTALCTRAALHGLWLLRLHRGGKSPIDAVHRTRRRFQKDLISFILGVWLVLGVALVESNLKEGVRIRPEAKASLLCVSVFGKFHPERVKELRPPYRTTVEPWVLSVGSMLQCPFGVVSVGVGGATDSFGNKRNMSAPVCSDIGVNVSSGVVKADIGRVELEEGVVEPEFGDTEAFFLFPLFPARLGLGTNRVGLEGEGDGICGKLGISGVFWTLGGDYQTTFAHVLNISFAVHERICREYGRRSNGIETIDDDVIRNCSEDHYLDASCVRNGAETGAVNSVDIEDVAALTVPKSLTDASYACLPSTARIEFVFVSASIARDVMKEGDPQLPVLLITRMVIIQGQCERTIGALAHAALLYTADCEWHENPLSTVDMRIRFYAFLMAVSTSQFPLHKLEKPEDGQGEDCRIHEVYTVSEIVIDWRAWILFAGLVATALVLLVGVVMRILFGGCWRVGSAEWSLAQVYGGGVGGDSEVAVEVVSSHGFSQSDGGTSRWKFARRWIVPEGVPWDHFEYRVRPGSLA